MSITVCLASGKDGVGKSTITANLALALSDLGIKTLAIDGDLEGASLGNIFGVEPGGKSLHDCLIGRIPCNDVISEAFGTNIIVGGITIEELVDVSIEHFPGILNELSASFDIILVDSPAGLGTDAVTVINSCQSVVFVLTPDINSVTNTLKTLAVAKKVGTAILGAIINRTGGRFDIPAEKIADLLKIKIITEIEENEEVKQALNDGIPIFKGDPESDFSKQIIYITRLLTGG